MKKKKGTGSCIICLNLYKSQNLDKHMHGLAHHEAIERLTGREYMHKCWACDVSMPGLKQFRTHIETKEHISKLFSMKLQRQNGFTVDYNNDELNALCARRDQECHLIKQQKHKEKMKKWKERQATKFQEACNQKSQHKITAARKCHNGESVTCPPSNENRQGVMNAEPVPQSVSEEGAQIPSWNRFYWQTSKWPMKDDVDFTSDPLAHPGSVSYWEEDKAQKNISQKQDRKRSCDANISDSRPVKRQSFRDVPSKKPRLTPSVCSEKVESEHRTRCTPTSAPLSTPVLVQREIDCLSVMLRKIRKAVDEQHTSDVPDLRSRSVSDKGLKRNERDKHMTLSDTQPEQNCPQESSVKSQTCHEQTFKSKGKSSPHKQLKRLSASSADPQEKPEPTQTRHVLPTLLSRSVSKTEANKPNLKAARGIRTAHKPSQAAESRVLKPALQKLISSKNSQWRVNWKEIYQEATHRRLEREKGMPRFGIELVTPLPPDSQDLMAQDLAHFELDEGFQWASVECDAEPLPSSVNRSSEDICGFPPDSPSTTTSSPEEEKKIGGECHSTSGMAKSSGFVVDQPDNCYINDRNTSHKLNLTPLDTSVCVKTEKLDDYFTKAMQEKADHNRMPSIPVTQIKPEKQDFTSADTVNKNPPKKHVSELLVISLRENELCSSLEDVDGQLLQAQAALNSALMHVQHLQMIKQQVTAEMSSLRSERINILQKLKRSNQTSSADSHDPAVEIHQRSTVSLMSRKYQDSSQDGVSFQSDVHQSLYQYANTEAQRCTNLNLALVLGSETRKTHIELSKSTVTHLHQRSTEAGLNTSL